MNDKVCRIQFNNPIMPAIKWQFISQIPAWSLKFGGDVESTSSPADYLQVGFYTSIKKETLTQTL